MEKIISKLKSKIVKLPVIAGGEFSNGKVKSMKMKVVGYDFYLQTFQVDCYNDGYKDEYIIDSKRIKRILK